MAQGMTDDEAVAELSYLRLMSGHDPLVRVVAAIDTDMDVRAILVAAVEALAGTMVRDFQAAGLLPPTERPDPTTVSKAAADYVRPFTTWWKPGPPTWDNLA